MKESSFARLLKEKLSPIGHWTRIENVAGVGVPDVNWYPGQDIWMELKVTNTHKVKFQASQISWGKLRHKKGGGIWVVIRTEKEIIISDSRAVYDKIQYENSKPWLHVNVAKNLGITFKKPFKWETLIGVLLMKENSDITIGDVL